MPRHNGNTRRASRAQRRRNRVYQSRLAERARQREEQAQRRAAQRASNRPTSDQDTRED